ncbi:MAG: DUF389 domain-containing protein [Nocardioidaceae bacterium]|nr:DUF389 domain-containing protein [Nocardioidaceae bacterium]
MLHVRLTAPSSLCSRVVERIETDPGVVNVVVVPGVVRSCDGDLVMFDLAREGANRVLDDLRRLDVPRLGSLVIEESQTVLSDAATDAERAVPGSPADAVIWDAVEQDACRNATLTWTFVSFMVLATLIASIGRYLDQPILIIGAMVVGPEFGPLAAVCFGLARGRWRLIGRAVRTLAAAMGVAAAVAWLLWAVASLLGAVDEVAATSGDLTEFIVAPDVWSLVVAMLAGVAGVLSLTAAKSSALVGVFISVTTIPAVGTFALTLAVGDLHEAASALAQLAINLAGIVVAGTITLAVQATLWRHLQSPDR